MKNARGLLSIVVACGVVACGGGGDDGPGGPVPFGIVPDEMTVTSLGGPGTCPAAGSSVDVFIFNGVAPYSIINTSPQRLTLSTTTVANRGGSFTVTSNGGCFENMIVVVEDSLRNQKQFTFSSLEGE